jgi:hypothetical protein
MASALAVAGNTFKRIGSSEGFSAERCFSNTNYIYKKNSNIEIPKFAAVMELWSVGVGE